MYHCKDLGATCDIWYCCQKGCQQERDISLKPRVKQLEGSQTLRKISGNQQVAKLRRNQRGKGNTEAMVHCMVCIVVLLLKEPSGCAYSSFSVNVELAMPMARGCELWGHDSMNAVYPYMHGKLNINLLPYCHENLHNHKGPTPSSLRRRRFLHGRELLARAILN